MPVDPTIAGLKLTINSGVVPMTSLENASGSHACWFEALAYVVWPMEFRSVFTPLTVHTVNWVQILKAVAYIDTNGWWR
jgi:hypothetical protein